MRALARSVASLLAVLAPAALVLAALVLAVGPAAARDEPPMTAEQTPADPPPAPPEALSPEGPPARRPGAVVLQACGDRAQHVDALRERYGETTRGVGLTGAGAVFELLVAEDGSWTLLVSFADGRSCLVAAGHDWESIPSAPPGRDS